MREKLAALQRRLDEIGFEGTRRAVASFVFAALGTLYLLVSINAPPGWSRAFVALAACYVTACLAVAAEWFWGRWFASGLGWSQVVVSFFSMFLIGWSPVLAVYGGLHAVAVVVLMGKTMAVRYDLQEGWRQRWAMDEYGVARLRRTVTRASASLPSLILWALGPREGQDSYATTLFTTGASLALLLVVLVGLTGLLRLRSWGVLALAAAALILPWLAGISSSLAMAPGQGALTTVGAIATAPNLGGLAPAVAAALLLSSLLPLAKPLYRWLRP